MRALAQISISCLIVLVIVLLVLHFHQPEKPQQSAVAPLAHPNVGLAGEVVNTSDDDSASALRLQYDRPGFSSTR